MFGELLEHDSKLRITELHQERVIRKKDNKTFLLTARGHLDGLQAQGTWRLKESKGITDLDIIRTLTIRYTNDTIPVQLHQRLMRAHRAILNLLAVIMLPHDGDTVLVIHMIWRCHQWATSPNVCSQVRRDDFAGKMITRCGPISPLSTYLARLLCPSHSYRSAVTSVAKGAECFHPIPCVLYTSISSESLGNKHLEPSLLFL